MQKIRRYINLFDYVTFKNNINIIYKKGGNNIMFGFFKKTLAVCLIGIGLGILLVLLLPLTGWLFLIGITICIVGLIWLAC